MKTEEKSLGEHEDRFDRRNYFAMLLSWVILAPTWTITIPYFQHYILALGGNEYIVGLIAAISGYTLATVRIIGGYLTDVIGRKKVIVIFTYVLSFTYLLFYVAWDWRIVLIASVISNLALIYQPALNAIIADSLPKSHRGRGLGLINFANGVSGLVAIYLALYLVSNYGVVEGVRWGYLISFFLILFAAIIRMVFLRETIKVQNLKELDIVKDFVDDYKYALSWIIKHLKPIITVAFILNIISGLTYLLPLYVTYYLGLGEEFWGYYYMFIFAIQLLFSIPSGFIADKIGRKTAIATGATGMFLSSIIFYLIGIGFFTGDVLPILLLAGAFMGISNSLGFLSIQSTVADLTIPEVRGKISALFGFIMNFSLSTGQMISGYIYNTYSPPMIFVLSAMVSILGVTYAYLGVRETVTKDDKTLAKKDV